MPKEGLQFTYTITGLAEIVKEYEDLEKSSTKHMPELLNEVGKVMVRQTHERMGSEKSAPDGNPWPPNKDGSDLLIKSGKLYNSIEYEIGSGFVTAYTDVAYAEVHQAGARIKSHSRPMVFMSGGRWWRANEVNIPARPFMGFSAANSLEIEEVVERIVFSWLTKDG